MEFGRFWPSQFGFGTTFGSRWNDGFSPTWERFHSLHGRYDSWKRIIASPLASHDASHHPPNSREQDLTLWGQDPKLWAMWSQATAGRTTWKIAECVLLGHKIPEHCVIRSVAANRAGRPFAQARGIRKSHRAAPVHPAALRNLNKSRIAPNPPNCPTNSKIRRFCQKYPKSLSLPPPPLPTHTHTHTTCTLTARFSLIKAGLSLIKAWFYLVKGRFAQLKLGFT